MQGIQKYASTATAVTTPLATVGSDDSAFLASSVSVSREGAWLSVEDNDGWASASGTISRHPTEAVGSDWKIPWGSGFASKVAERATASVSIAANGEVDTFRLLTGHTGEWNGTLTSFGDIEVSDDLELWRKPVVIHASALPNHPVHCVVKAATASGKFYYPQSLRLDYDDWCIVNAPLAGSGENVIFEQEEPTGSAYPLTRERTYVEKSATYGMSPHRFPGLTGGQVAWNARSSAISDSDVTCSFRVGVTASTIGTVGWSARPQPGTSGLKAYVRLLGSARSEFYVDGTKIGDFDLPEGDHTVSFTLKAAPTFGAYVMVDGRTALTGTQPTSVIPTKNDEYWFAYGSMTGGVLAGVQVGRPALSHVDTAPPSEGWGVRFNATSNDFRTATRPRARPFISKDASSIIREVCSSLGWCAGIDEYGNLAISSWRWALAQDGAARKPSASFDVNSTLAGLSWDGKRRSMPEDIVVKRREPSISVDDPIVWVAEDMVFSRTQTHEEFIGPDTDTDWVDLDTEFVRDWSNTSSCFDSQVEFKSPGGAGGTGVNKVTLGRMPRDDRYRLAVDVSVGTGAALYLRFDSGPYVGGPSPVVRAAKKVTWREVSVRSNDVGPAFGGEYTHDGGWCLSASEADAIKKELIRQVQTPMENISGLEVWPEPGLQIGDHIMLRFDTAGTASPVSSVQMLVTRIENSISGGSYKQTLDGRVVSYRRAVMWDQVDAAYSNSMWDAVDGKLASKTWNQVDADPLA